MLRFTLYFLFIAITAMAQHPSGQVAYRSIPVEAGKTGADPELELIRGKVAADMLAGRLDPQQIQLLIETFQQEGTWPGIDYADVSRTGFEHRIHLSNVLLLARAYKAPSASSHRDKRVLSMIEKALAFWVKHDFICDNWWWNEMGTPNAIISILMVMDDDLPRELKAPLLRIAGRANMEASGARPSTVNVLARTNSLHAVWDQEQGILQAAFFEPDTLVLPNGESIQADSPCMLLVHFEGKTITRLAVSDPGRAQALLYLKTTFQHPAKSLPTFASTVPSASDTLWEIQLPENEMAGKSAVIDFQ